MSKETGLDKLNRLIKMEIDEIEDEIGDEKEGKIVEKKSFGVMITLFCKFLMLNPLVAPLRLRMSKNNNGYVVYQGTIHHPWVFLRLGKCNFIRSALLDCIKRLPEDDFLYQYFEKYTKKG